MQDNQAIGVFDSGLGGLTVVKEIQKILPYEDIIYFGDTARVPYGNKSKETIVKFSIENIEFLLKFRVKIIVIACNTSCSLSMNIIKRRYDLPIIGVIEPAIKRALKISKNLRIGIIGTRSTIKSSVYTKGLKRLNKKVKVYLKSCPLFVPLVEEGWIEENVTLDIAKKYLIPLKKKNIDTLILACTHYPLLMRTIQNVIGKKVKLINSASEVAQEIKEVLSKRGDLRESKSKGKSIYYVSDEVSRFVEIGQRFLGKKIRHVRRV